MKINIVSGPTSWKNDFIPALARSLRQRGHRVRWVHRLAQIQRGDVLIIAGFTKLLPPQTLLRNRHNIVFHESRLPLGKGWSPLSWQILEGKNRIPVTLFEAVEKVDAGPVYSRGVIILKGHELLDEIRQIAASKMYQMFLHWIEHRDRLVKQGSLLRGRSTFYARRTSEACELNVHQSLKKQFNLLRIADPLRYPAFFRLRGCTYEIQLKKRTTA